MQYNVRMKIYTSRQFRVLVLDGTWHKECINRGSRLRCVEAKGKEQTRPGRKGWNVILQDNLCHTQLDCQPWMYYHNFSPDFHNYTQQLFSTVAKMLAAAWVHVLWYNLIVSFVCTNISIILWCLHQTLALLKVAPPAPLRPFPTSEAPPNSQGGILEKWWPTYCSDPWLAARHLSYPLMAPLSPLLIFVHFTTKQI